MKPRPLFLSLLLFAQLTVAVTAGTLSSELARRLGTALSFLLPLVFCLRAPKPTPRAALLPRRRADYAALWLCPAFVLLTAAVAALWGLLCTALGVEVTGAEPYGTLGLSLLFDALIPAVCEEIFCRGVLFAVLRPMGRRTAVFGSAVLFALMHASVAQIPYALLAGVLLAALYELTGGLLLPILFHVANNATSLLLLFGAPPLPVYATLGTLSVLGGGLFLRAWRRAGGAIPAETECERGNVRELLLSPLSAYLAVMLIFTVL